MATAYLLNTTPFRIAVNLNAELQNHSLDALTVASDAKAVCLSAWAAPTAASASRGVFGGNGQRNLLTVFSEGRPVPALYEISSTVSTALDLYLYVLGEIVVGADSTGATSGITVKVVSPELAAQNREYLAMHHQPASRTGLANANG